ANFGRAEIEILAVGRNFHRVEKLPAKRLHAGDVSTALGKQLLQERSVVDPKPDLTAFEPLVEFLGRIDANYAGAASANVWLDDNWKADVIRVARQLI